LPKWGLDFGKNGTNTKLYKANKRGSPLGQLYLIVGNAGTVLKLYV